MVSPAYLKLLIFFPPSNLDSSLCFLQPSVSHDVLCIIASHITSLMYRRVSSHCQEEDGIRWQSKKMCAHLLLRELQNYNLLLNNHQLENVGSHQKKIPHIQGQRRSPKKMVGGANLHLELNPLCTRDAQRTQTNLVSTSTKIPQKD